MSDYDLVIIGHTPAGIHAAVMAAEVRARVVLVTQGALGEGQAHSVWTEAGHNRYRVQKGGQFWGELGTIDPAPWGQVDRWARVMAMTEAAVSSPPLLASLGVEVIDARGEFCRKPAPGFMVDGRRLRSRTYLLATPNHFPLPAIEGLSSVPYETPDTVLQRLGASISPQHLLILGHTPTAVEMAQSLNRLGVKTTLLTSQRRLLPQEDPETSHLVQALLEAEGITLLTHTPIHQFRLVEGRPVAQIGDRTIACDLVLVATAQAPDVAALNLEAVGVRWDEEGILTNARLQTSNPRIYACTNPTDYDASQVDVYRATIATRNALFLPLLTVKQPLLTWTVNTDPPVARIGFTESQARQRTKGNILVLRQEFKTLGKARLQSQPTGFCKLIVRPQGKILGAHLVGAEAAEMIGTIALAIQKNVKVQELASLPLPSHSFSDVIRTTAAEWHRQQLQQNIGLQDFLEGFFSLRRSWF